MNFMIPINYNFRKETTPLNADGSWGIHRKLSLGGGPGSLTEERFCGVPTEMQESRLPMARPQPGKGQGVVS